MSKHAPAPLPAPLRGIVPPLVTPLAGRDELDVAGLDRLLDHVLAGGVTGVFVLGTTGEASSLGAAQGGADRPDVPARGRARARARGGNG